MVYAAGQSKLGFQLFNSHKDLTNEIAMHNIDMSQCGHFSCAAS